MSIYIVTDSASDIEHAEYGNVIVLPMTITIDGKAYRDGVDLTKNDFYQLLETSESIPASSLVAPYQFEDAFRELEARGDEAIAITISAELSGTYESACSAADSWTNVSVIDSRQASGAQKLLVLRALQLVSQGLSRAEIVAKLEEEKERIVIYAALDTLDYLLKGGRISKTSALVGSIIGIKPVVTLEDGELIAIGKAHGGKKSRAFLTTKIHEVGGIDFSMPYAVGYSGTEMANLRKYLDDNQELIGSAPHEPDIVQIGSTVGTHCGPGTVLVTFYKKPAR